MRRILIAAVVVFTLLDTRFVRGGVGSGGTLSLNFGVTHSGTIEFPSQQDRFTLIGSAGQRLYFDTLDYDSEPITATLYAPSSVIVFSVTHSSDTGPFYLTESGTYVLVIDATGEATGDYSFRMLDLANAGLLALGVTATNQLDPRSETVSYQFQGMAGQKIAAQNIHASYNAANWRLISPGGLVLFNTGILTSPGEIFLPETGSYTLLFEGNSEGVTPLGFQARLSLVSSPSVTPTGFGVERSGSITNGMTNTYTFNAPAGLLVYFDYLTNSYVAHYQLLGPNGVQVFDAYPASDFGPYVLQVNGAYTLNVIGFDAGNYRFRLLDLSSASSSTVSNLAFGVTYASTLTPAFRTDVFRFNGVPGQTLLYDAIDNDFDAVTARILDPTFNSLPFGHPNADYDEGPYRLTLPGTYYLVIESQLPDNTTDHRFRILEMGTPPVETLPLNTTVNGVLAPGTAATFYRFAAAAGQVLYLDAAQTNTGGSWYLYGPSGAYVTSGGLSSDFGYTAPVAGTYFIALVDLNYSTNPIPYSLRVLGPAINSIPLTLGATLNGAIATVGQEDRYSFTGAPGQNLYYDALDTDGDSVSAQLVYPNGSIVAINGNAESDSGPFTLNQAGTYTLVLRAGDALGSYSFRLIDLAQLPAHALPFNTSTSGVLDPGTRVDWYRVNAVAGQRLYFDAAATNTLGGWNLYNPLGQNVAGVSLNQDIEHLAALSGFYYIAVWSSGLTAAPYSVRALAPATVISPYTLGTTISTVLAGSAEERRYTFSGVAGQRLYYDALDADGEAIYAYLYDPAGNNIFIGGNSESDVGLFTLPYSGTYTLLFRGLGETTGDFQFRLLDLAAAPQISYGVDVIEELRPQLQTHLYRIAGVGGQHITGESIGASSGNANWYVANPLNQILLTGGITANLGDRVLLTTGTYAVIVSGNFAGFGGLDYQVRVSLASTPSGTPSGFGSLISGTTSPGLVQTYTFTAPAGLPVYFDSLTNNAVAAYRLEGPNDSVVFDIAPTVDAGPYFLPTNGVYTLKVIGVNTGDFRFRLIDLTSLSVSDLSFGATYTQTLSPALRTDIYRFTGANGQRLVYDSLQYQFDSVAVRLYNSSGAIVYLNGNADTEPPPFTLSEPGTYYLVIENTSTDPAADYSIRLINVAQSPAAAIPFDTPVNGNLDPGTRSDVYRFTGSKGQRLYFDAMPTNSNAAYWQIFSPGNLTTYTHLNTDFDWILPEDGQYVLVAGYGQVANPVPYSIRIVTPTDSTNALNFGATASGAISEQVESDYYVFTGAAGQRLYYDALYTDGGALQVQIVSPSGYASFLTVFGHAQTDAGLFTLTESGTYRLRIFGPNHGIGPYSFRLLEVSAAPILSYDSIVYDSVGAPYGAVLYRVPTTPSLRLYFDHWTAHNPSGTYNFYDAHNASMGSTAFGTDLELTPSMHGTHVLALNSAVAEPVPYIFQVVPGNHAPVLAAISNRCIYADTTLNFVAAATDAELPDDVLTWSLDEAPLGAEINPNTGSFSWTPPRSLENTVHTITVRVTDNGVPSLSATRSFTVCVVFAPVIVSIVPSNGLVTITWSSIAGQSYRVQRNDTLDDATWNTLADVTAVGLTASRTDALTSSNRFFRIRVLQ